jgi:peroxiredoxin
MTGLLLPDVFQVPNSRFFSRQGTKSVNRKGLAFLVIFTASLLLIFFGQHNNPPNLPRILAGSYSPAPQEPKVLAATALPARAMEKSSEGKAPDFTLTSLDGSQVTLSSFKGKKGVVLAFFATWCVNCMKEVPEIKKFALMAQKENVEVLAINFKQRADIVERFQKSHSISYRILLDMDGAVALGKYGIKGIPHIIGIDAKGEMIYRGEDLPVKKTEFIEKLNQGL